MNNLYCVIYRTGGYENFQWHRTSAMTRSKAIQTADVVKKGGRQAFIEKYDLSMAIGLPEGYDMTETIEYV